jgi:hypothetical protein
MSEDFSKFWGFFLVIFFLTLLWNSIGAQVKNNQVVKRGYSNPASVILSTENF